MPGKNSKSIDDLSLEEMIAEFRRNRTQEGVSRTEHHDQAEETAAEIPRQTAATRAAIFPPDEPASEGRGALQLADSGRGSLPVFTSEEFPTRRDSVQSRSRTPIVPIDAEKLLRESIAKEGKSRYSEIPPPIQDNVSAPPPSNPPPSQNTPRISLIPRSYHHVSLSERFRRLDERTRRALMLIYMKRESTSAFYTAYFEQRTENNSFLAEVSKFLNRSLISLPAEFSGSKKINPGQPNAGRTITGQSKWIIVDCTEASLDSLHPMISVVKEESYGLPAPETITIPLHVIFLSNSIF